MSYIKRLFPFFIILVLLLIVKNNIDAVFNSLQNVNTAGNLEKQLEIENKESRYLQERLKYVKTEQFVEEQAKEKLGLLKPGEFFVIAPTATPLDKSLPKKVEPNWKKWLELFF
jgi:cell division protein FtsB